MAQNITLLGASYSDVPAVELPKTGGGTAAFYDVSETTATAEDVLNNKVFISANGTITIGTGDDSMVIVAYGKSTYAEVLAAYQSSKVVYCRASTGSNPASGAQVRMAFLAYVNNETTPTSFEFQYYRSVQTHTDAQQGDQVYIYTINSQNKWAVTVRSAFTKIVAGTGLTSSYSNGVLTMNSELNQYLTIEEDDEE